MKLDTMLRERGVSFEKHSHRPAYTAQGLAAEEHVTGYVVAKPVVVRSSAGFVMCVIPAPAHLDLGKVADVLDDRNVRLATEAEMGQLFPDCELGAEPPTGVLFNMDTIMDERLAEDEYLVMQAGTHTDAIKMLREDWERLCTPTIAAVTG